MYVCVHVCITRKHVGFVFLCFGLIKHVQCHTVWYA